MGSIKIKCRQRLNNNIRTEIIRLVENCKLAVGEEVTAEMVVGEKREFLDKEVGVGKAKVFVKVGDRVEAGTKLGEKRSFFGLGHKEIASPVSGEVIEVGGGRIAIRERLKSEVVAAGCWGKVQQVSPGQISILTAVDEFFGVAGLGGSDEGFVRRVAGPNEIVTPHQINQQCRSCIILGGSLLLPESLEKATAIGVRGVVVGGMHYRDYLSFQNKKNCLPVVLTEGFGALVQTLEIPEGFGIITGSQKKLVVPRNVPDKDWQTGTDEDVTMVELRLGLRVRILCLDFFGKIGQVVSISEREERLESGLSALVARVQIGEQTVKIAVDNLEAI